jgi:hypothetical protein
MKENCRNKLQKSFRGENGWKMLFSRSENAFPTLEMTCKSVSKLQERERGEHIC